MKDDRLYLIHIRDSIARIKQYTKEGKEAFFASTLVQDAVMRNLQTLTESSQRLSVDFRNRHPKMDWRGMAGLRNVLVHQYMGIDLVRVWSIVERDLPRLQRMLYPVLKGLRQPPSIKKKRKSISRSKGQKKNKK
jgi:uncharacterized protein with HEPN domain